MHTYSNIWMRTVVFECLQRYSGRITVPVVGRRIQLHRENEKLVLITIYVYVIKFLFDCKPLDKMIILIDEKVILRKRPIHSQLKILLKQKNTFFFRK